jgi:enediyne biosynthesis protein E4
MIKARNFRMEQTLSSRGRIGAPWARWAVFASPLLLGLALSDLKRLPDCVFSDVTPGSHLDALATSGSARNKKLMPEGMTGGICTFDYDNDGLIDVYIVSGPDESGHTHRSHLFRNKGDGTFTDVTASAGVGGPAWGMGCSVADFNNDGYKDLFVTGYEGNVLYKNNGDGTFSDVTASSGLSFSGWSTGSAWLDYDRDGFVDLYVANYIKPDSVRAHAADVCNYLGFQVMCGPTPLEPEADILYHNNGNGTFTDVTAQAGVNVTPRYGLGVATVDFNDDGNVDIFVANDSGPNFLFENQGNGKFVEIGLQAGVAVTMITTATRTFSSQLFPRIRRLFTETWGMVRSKT